MAAAENIAINFVTAYKGKGVADATQNISSFEKVANKAAKTFASIFAVQKITAFGRASINAFTEDQLAAEQLSKTLTNLGLGFQSTGVENFIQKLETATGVLDEQLRPAFARLVRQTGDVNKTQDLLNLALDISAGTGNDLMTVSNALAKAYGGQYTSLSKLGAGLTKADLSSKSFKSIQDKLQMLFSGQAATAADSYAGKINRLKVGFDNLKEGIGQGLISAFTAIAGPDGSITKATDQMAQFGVTIGDAIAGLGVLIGKLTTPVKETGLAGYIQGFTKTTGIGSLNPADYPIIKLLAKIGKDSKTISKGTLDQQLDVLYKQIEAERKRQIIVKANADATAKADAAAKKAKADQLALEKASAALKLASKVTSMDQIQLYAAIAQAQGQDLDRLRLQQALLDGNAASATILADKVLRANGLVMDMQGKISADPFAAWTTSLDNMLDAAIKAAAEIAKIKASITPSSGNTGGGGGGTPLTSTPAVQDLISTLSNNPNYTSIGGQALINAIATQAAQDINLNISLDQGLIVRQTQDASSNGTPLGLSRNNPGYFIPQS
jgi:hypothetical protein